MNECIVTYESLDIRIIFSALPSWKINPTKFYPGAFLLVLENFRALKGDLDLGSGEGLI